MAGKYASDHKGALADLAAAGVALTFSRVTPGVEAVAGTFAAPTTTTVASGSGMVVAGNAQEYQAAGLTMVNAPTILFVPDDYGLAAYTDEFVLPGDIVTLNGYIFKVKAVLSVVAPDGIVMVSRIAVSL